VSSEHVQHLFRLDDTGAPSRLFLSFLIHMQTKLIKTKESDKENEEVGGG